MKALIAISLSLLLGGCSATMVSYQSGSSKSACPPVISVHSLGGNVTVADGAECKAVNK